VLLRGGEELVVFDVPHVAIRLTRYIGDQLAKAPVRIALTELRQPIE
jgi:hypothetical protein